MLFLQFKIGGDRYAIEAKNVVEVVPFVMLKKMPKAPHYVAGLLNFRGKTIPVIDICYLMTNRACERKLSSRIAMVNYKKSKDGRICIGLLIEHMTETGVWEESDFSESGVKTKDNKCLGDVVVDDNGIIQKIDPDKILPDEAYEILSMDKPKV